MEIETGPDLIRETQNVDLLNHCAICLTNFDSENCKDVRVVLEEGVSLKHLWSYFLETDREDGGCSSLQTWTFVNPMKTEGTTIPPLCLDCSEIILELNKRHQAYIETWRIFQVQIKLLHSLLVQKENRQKYEEFQKRLERADKLDVCGKQKTIMFLENIRRKVGDTDYDPGISSESPEDYYLDSRNGEEIQVEVKNESLDLNEATIEDDKWDADVKSAEASDAYASVSVDDNESASIDDVSDDRSNQMEEEDYDGHGDDDDNNDEESDDDDDNDEESVVDDNDEESDNDNDNDSYEPDSVNNDSSSICEVEEEPISINTPVSTSRRKAPVVKRNIIEDEDPLAEISFPSYSKQFKIMNTPEASVFNPRLLSRKPRRFDPNRCHLCNFIVTPSKRRLHYATRHRNHPYNCDICGYNILPEEFTAHLVSHVGDYITKCTNSKCSYVAINPQRLWKLHLSRRDQACKDAGQKYSEFCDKIPRKCEYCNMNAKSVSCARMQTHVFDYHEAKSTVKSLPCPVETCDKKFAYRETVQLHLSDHAISTQIFEEQPCSVCYKLYMPPNVLAFHLRGFHKFNEIIKCEHCPYIFGTRKHLLDHICEFHVKTMGGVRCDICKDKDPTRYTKIGHIRVHYHQAHQIGEPLICDQCGFSTFAEVDFNFHKRDDDRYKLSMPKDLIKCEMCEEKFVSKLKQWIHMRDVHNDKRPNPNGRYKPKIRQYACTSCDQIFNKKIHLLAHCRSAHPKTHFCECCGKSFKTARGLNVHRKLHEGERPFICDVCSHAFAQQGDLNSHMRIHTGERPYKCSMCDESFRQRTGLRKHSLAVHKVDKTYTCNRDPSCGKSFTTYKELAHHEIREHENVCHLCTEERKEFQTRKELKIHLRSRHRSTFSFKCDQCDTACANEAGLDIHRKKMH